MKSYKIQKFKIFQLERLIPKQKKMDVKLITDTDYDRIMREALPYFESLRLLAETCDEQPEGNIYYKHGTYEVNPDTVNVQKNLLSLAKVSDKILEIGFNMGHSCVLMLLSNPDCVVHCLDAGIHSYTKLCWEYLNLQFPGRVVLFLGPSHITLKTYNGPLLDLIHVDGCHDYNTANIDFFLSRGKVRNNGIIVFDDTWMKHLGDLWAGYINSGLVHPIPGLLETHGETAGHSIGRVIYPKFRIAVCSLAFGEDYVKLVEKGEKGREMYCSRLGYDYRTDKDVYDPKRPYAWSKVKLVLKCLSEMKYDYVVWIDADTHIIDFDKRLESIVEKHLQSDRNRDILIASDWQKINSGVFFVRTTEWAYRFFTELYEQTEFLTHSNWEQEAMISMLDKDILGCKEKFMILPDYLQSEFNSYNTGYKAGDFLVHFAGCYRDGVDKGLGLLMNEFCPYRLSQDTNQTFVDRLKKIGKLD